MVEKANEFLVNLVKLSDENPDECLKQISTLLSSEESLSNNPIPLMVRGVATIKKAALLKKDQGAWTDELFDLLEAGLKDCKLVDSLAPNVKVFEEFKDAIDAACRVLEAKRPGSVQSIIGKTKLRFFMSGKGRLSINTGCEEYLIPSDQAVELFSDFYFKFPKIVRSAFIFFMDKDEKNRHYLHVALFEEPYLKNAFGEVSKTVGYVRIFEDGEIEEHLSGAAGDGKKEESEDKPKKRGFFSKVFK